MADGESKAERLDQELMELLEELRVVLPGVQVALAFLLTAPFQQRFASLGQPPQRLLPAAIVCATLATVLLIAPWPITGCAGGEKERILRIGNQMALWGGVPGRGDRARPVRGHQRPVHQRAGPGHGSRGRAGVRRDLVRPAHARQARHGRWRAASGEPGCQLPANSKKPAWSSPIWLT